MKLTGGTLVTVVESHDTKHCSECFHRAHVGNSDIYSFSNWKCRFKGYRDDSTWTNWKKVLIRLLECRQKEIVVSGADDDFLDDLLLEYSEKRIKDVDSESELSDLEALMIEHCYDSTSCYESSVDEVNGSKAKIKRGNDMRDFIFDDDDDMSYER